MSFISCLVFMSTVNYRYNIPIYSETCCNNLYIYPYVSVKISLIAHWNISSLPFLLINHKMGSVYWVEDTEEVYINPNNREMSALGAFYLLWSVWWICYYMYLMNFINHYSDVIMSAMMFKITGVSIVYSTVCSGVDYGKHQSTASLAFVYVCVCVCVWGGGVTGH